MYVMLPWNLWNPGNDLIHNAVIPTTKVQHPGVHLNAVPLLLLQNNTFPGIILKQGTHLNSVSCELMDLF